MIRLYSVSTTFISSSNRLISAKLRAYSVAIPCKYLKTMPIVLIKFVVRFCTVLKVHIRTSFRSTRF